jgi:hypothetical protein
MPSKTMPDMSLTPETIQNLEQCCADLFTVYRRAMAMAEPIEKRGRKLKMAEARASSQMFMHKVFGAPKPSTEHEEMRNALREDLQRYERDRAKFRSKANLYRRQAETILKVLEWAAPDKSREERLRTGSERAEPPTSKQITAAQA